MGTNVKKSSSEQGRRKHTLLGLTVATCLILLIYIFTASGWGQLFGPLTALLKVSLSKIRLLYLLWTIGYLPGALVGGILLDRYGPRIVFFGAGFLILGGLFLFLLYLLQPHLAPFLLLLIFIGIIGGGGGVIEASTNGLISDAYSDRRGMMLNLFNALYPLGAMLLALIDAGLFALFPNNPFPALFFILGFSSVAMLSILAIPKTYRLKNCPETLHGTIENVPALLPTLAPVIVIMMLTTGLNTSLHTWAPTYMHLAFQEQADLTAILTAVVWATAAGSRMGAAWLITCIGSWKMIMLSLIISLLGLLLLLFSTNIIIATVAIALSSLGLAPTFSTLLTIAGERTERTAGSVTGLLLFSSGLCTIGCSWLFGFLLGTLGAFWPILLCLLLVGVSLITGWLLRSAQRT
jgi:MFS family permease